MKRLLSILLFLPLFAGAQMTGASFHGAYHVVATAPSGCPSTPANTYLAAVTASGTTPNSTQEAAVCSLFVDGAAGQDWLTTREVMYIPIWGAAAADAINAVNPGTYNLTWVGSPSHTSSGIPWNGSSQYATSTLAANTMGQNSASITYYSQTSSSSGSRGAGAASSGTGYLTVTPRFGNGVMGGTVSRGAIYSRTAAGYNGMFSAVRTSSTVLKLFRNGAQQGTTITDASVALTSANVFWGTNSFGTSPDNYGGYKWSYGDAGDGLTDAQEAQHYTDVQAFHTALGIAQ